MGPQELVQAPYTLNFGQNNRSFFEEEGRDIPSLVRGPCFFSFFSFLFFSFFVLCFSFLFCFPLFSLSSLPPKL